MSNNIIPIIINGRGGCGKDTLVDYTIEYFNNSIDIRNISSITPVKEIAKQLGWEESDKSNKARKFLSDLKKILIEWNNLPNKYIIEYIDKLKNTGTPTIVFIHIREISEIEKIKYLFSSKKLKPVTILIKSPVTDENVYGNNSDDNVEFYNYDHIFINDKSIGILASGNKFIQLLKNKVFKNFY